MVQTAVRMVQTAVRMPPREKWANKAEFLLSCIGYAVGLGNIWRFPYLCMRNGGGAFLVPYLVFLVLCGLPLCFLEMALGQFSGCSTVTVFRLCPLFTGVGWGMVLVSVVYSIYYSTILAWVIYYLGTSMRSQPLWQGCNNTWNTPQCIIVGQNQENGTTFNGTSSAEEFFSYKVLGLSDGIDDPGTLKWDLCLCLLAAWCLLFCCVSRGIKSSGKAVYVTATLPYLLITIILIRGVTLPGSLKGIRYFIIPEWGKILKVQVWIDACTQIFFSLGPAMGTLITYSTFNDFHNNCLRDAVIVSLVNSGTSLYAGFAVFAVVGYMSHMTGIPVDKVATQGPGLAFIAYPGAISQLPLPTFWAIIFFLTLLTLGLDSVMGNLEAVIHGFLDEYPNRLRKHKTLFIFVLCLVMFLLALPFVSKGGMYLFHLVDWYAFTFSMVILGLGECIVVSYFYGVGRFYSDMELMLKVMPSKVWAVAWAGVTILLLTIMFVISCVRITPPMYGEYVYPAWSIGLGWFIGIVPIIPIPVMFILKVALAGDGSLFKRLQQSVRPDPRWGPANVNVKDDDTTKVYTTKSGLCAKLRIPTRQRFTSVEAQESKLLDQLHTSAPVAKDVQNIKLISTSQRNGN